MPVLWGWWGGEGAPRTGPWGKLPSGLSPLCPSWDAHWHGALCASHLDRQELRGIVGHCTGKVGSQATWKPLLVNSLLTQMNKQGP